MPCLGPRLCHVARLSCFPRTSEEAVGRPSAHGGVSPGASAGHCLVGARLDFEASAQAWPPPVSVMLRLDPSWPGHLCDSCSFYPQGARTCPLWGSRGRVFVASWSCVMKDLHGFCDRNSPDLSSQVSTRSSGAPSWGRSPAQGLCCPAHSGALPLRVCPQPGSVQLMLT